MKLEKEIESTYLETKQLNKSACFLEFYSITQHNVFDGLIESYFNRKDLESIENIQNKIRNYKTA